MARLALDHPRVVIDVDAVGYCDELARAEQWRASLPKGDALMRFGSLGTARLVISLPASGSKFPEFHGGGSGVPAQLFGVNIVIFEKAQHLDVNYQNILLTAVNIPYMEDFRGAPTDVRLTPALSAAPLVESNSDSTSVTAPGLAVRIRRPAA